MFIARPNAKCFQSLEALGVLKSIFIFRTLTPKYYYILPSLYKKAYHFLLILPRWIPGVIFYLASDALFLGLMATALCLSFFPEGLLRIALLTLLFPLLSLALCAWMTVFGFYLRWVKKNNFLFFICDHISQKAL